MITIDQLRIDPKKTSERVIEFIQKTIKSAGLNGAVVAVSGGIDSATTLAATTRALGPEKVTALTLPERDITPNGDVDDVMRLCETVGVTCEHVEITPMLRVMRENILGFDPSDRVAYGNIKARLRMLLTYYYANTRRAMVMGTSNKTELYFG